MVFFYLLLLSALWLIFLLGVILITGQTCRRTSWWHEEDKIQGYIEISNPRLARLLIPEYLGCSTHIQTNIPALYNVFYVNKYPTRLSLVGLADYGATAILGIWYGVCITAYFWFGWYDNPMIPLTVGLLMARAVLFMFLGAWNGSRVRLEEMELISRVEWRRRKRDRKNRNGEL